MDANLEKLPIRQARQTILVMILTILSALTTSRVDSSQKIGRSDNETTNFQPATRVDSRFIQVHPLPIDETSLIRSSGQARAIILIHGLQIHPVSNLEVLKASFRIWQMAHSQLVDTLAPEADVFAFAYSENVPLERIVNESLLKVKIGKLKDLGYTQIVLIGHSAGGLIARQFVEDYPDCGVTKVIQVCAPNAGTSVAHLESGVRRIQRSFLHCLTKEGRAVSLQERADKRIPASVQFVCVIGDGLGSGDFLISSTSQWPKDLQDQGIPAVALHTNHFAIMHSKTQALRIVEIVRYDMPRWNQSQVISMKKSLK
jgi:pimeloyl-ACP methyl ester carboxylesterase